MIDENDPAWDELVENFRRSAGSGPVEPSAEQRQEQLRRLFSTGPGALPGPRDHVLDDEGGDFVPPQPPALGSGNPAAVLAWVAAAGGVAGLMLCLLFFSQAPVVVYLALLLVAGGGIGYLLKSLPTHRDPGDDGAQV